MRYLLVLSGWAWALVSHAGVIAFDVQWLAEGFFVRNTGSQAAYALTAWSLDVSGRWLPAQAIEGNTATLLPERFVRWVRATPSTPSATKQSVSAVSQAEPLLLVFFDAAGSRFAQLAWKTPPPIATASLLVDRDGRTLTVHAPQAPTEIVATTAIRLADPGIARLTRSFSGHTPPPDPYRHVWEPGGAMRFDTGAGQRGAWLLHESKSGLLHVQIVPDAFPAREEQRTRWLGWARSLHGWIAAGLAFVAVIAMMGRAMALRRNHA